MTFANGNLLQPGGNSGNGIIHLNTIDQFCQLLSGTAGVAALVAVEEKKADDEDPLKSVSDCDACGSNVDFLKQRHLTLFQNGIVRSLHQTTSPRRTSMALSTTLSKMWDHMMRTSSSSTLN